MAATASCAVALMLGGCFTGIESTPKITSKDVSRENITVTAEDTFLTDIRPEPFPQWKPGKTFYVTDSKINLALEPTSAPTPQAGSYLWFRRSSEVPSISGTPDVEIVLADENGNEFVHRVNASPADLASRPRLNIPFTIEMSLVDRTRDALKDRTLWIRTPVWFDTDGHALGGLRFIPVRITDVVPGNLVYPVRIEFKPQAYTADAPRSAGVYLAVGSDNKSSRQFADVFYFTDPRKRHPMISDQTWDAIVHSRVQKYMTRDECRLALGAPKSVRTRNAITSLQEMWTYENGVYLIFEDGILQSFRR